MKLNIKREYVQGEARKHIFVVLDFGTEILPCHYPVLPSGLSSWENSIRPLEEGSALFLCKSKKGFDKFTDLLWEDAVFDASCPGGGSSCPGDEPTLLELGS